MRFPVSDWPSVYAEQWHVLIAGRYVTFPVSAWNEVVTVIVVVIRWMHKNGA